MKFLYCRSLLLALLTFGLMALFTIGCGDSRKDYVHTGSHVVSTTGELLFHFDTGLLAQTVSGPSLPAGTTSVRFDFYGAPDGDERGAFAFSEIHPPAEQILIERVSDAVRSVRVTAFNSDGVPLGVVTAELDVTPGVRQDIIVSSFHTDVVFDSIVTSPNFVELAFDESVSLTTKATYTLVGYGSYEVTVANDDPGLDYEVTNDEDAISFDTSTATVSFNTENGTATIRVVYTSDGVTHTDIVTVETATGEDESKDPSGGKRIFEVTVDETGSQAEPLEFPGVGGDDLPILTPDYSATLTTDGSDDSIDVSDDLLFKLTEEIDGVIGIDEDGFIELSYSFDGAAITVEVSYIDDQGEQFVEEVTFHVDGWPYAGKITTATAEVLTPIPMNTPVPWDDESWRESDSDLVAYPDTWSVDRFPSLIDGLYVGRFVRYTVEVRDYDDQAVDVEPDHLEFSLGDSVPGVSVELDGTINFLRDILVEYLQDNELEAIEFVVTVEYRDENGEYEPEEIRFVVQPPLGTLGL